LFQESVLLLVSALISGIGLGSMYGLMALGFYVTYAVSSTVNFAQGSSMMLGAVLTFALTRNLGLPMPLAILIALALCACYGLVVEFIAVRPFAVRGSDSWLMATVALGIVLDNAVMFTFGKEPRNLSSPLAQSSLEIGGVSLGVYPLQVIVPIVGVALAAALFYLSKRTRWGTAMLAIAQNRSAARLMGIPITKAVAFAYALSTLFAGIAGVLIAPLFNVHSEMGTLFGLKAFAVAILGGITSAWGVMIAGFIFGIAEALVTSTLGSGYTQIITFALVILALAWRPNGLFGRAEVKKV
jgi:branched-chain amino acid transport system permease protein